MNDPPSQKQIEEWDKVHHCSISLPGYFTDEKAYEAAERCIIASGMLAAMVKLFEEGGDIKIHFPVAGYSNKETNYKMVWQVT